MFHDVSHRNLRSFLRSKSNSGTKNKNHQKSLPMRDNEITLKKINRFDVNDMYIIGSPVVVGDPNYIKAIKECLMDGNMVFWVFAIMMILKKWFLTVRAAPLSVTT